MRAVLSLCVLSLLCLGLAPGAEEEPRSIAFEMKEIERGLGVGYAVLLVDVDGDGKLDFVLGAGWKPFDTKGGGTLQWLKQPKDLDDPWKLYPSATSR